MWRSMNSNIASTLCRSRKARRGRSPGGQGEGVRCYGLIRYVRSPLSDLKDSTVKPAFFIAPAINPLTVCLCQSIFSIISTSVAPFFRCSMATTRAVLLPSRGPSAFGLAAFLAGAIFGLAAAALGFPPLARFWLVGAPFLGLAPFFEEPFSGATCAPCVATAADRESVGEGK